jgi:hypothetical protein
MSGLCSRRMNPVYPAGNDFCFSYTLKELELLLGNIRILSASFELRDKTQMEEKLPSVNLSWTIILTAHVQGKKDLKYFISLEPFDGKITLLGRTVPILR